MTSAVSPMTPGVYHSTAALALTGILILDAQNDPDAVFVFQAGAAFNTAAAASMVLINGAQASNVYWVVTGAAGAGAASLLSGNILAKGAITLGLGTVLIGRALLAVGGHLGRQHHPVQCRSAAHDLDHRRRHPRHQGRNTDRRRDQGRPPRYRARSP